MKIHLRKRKQSKNGKINLFLEFYKGYEIRNGKASALRNYKSLDLFIYEKPSNHTEKQHNKQTLQLANSIRNKKELDIKSGIYGFNSHSKSNSNFIEYFKKLTEDRLKSKGNYGNWDSTLKHLTGYASSRVIFKNIDKEFCEGFKNYLINNVIKKNGERLSSSSISSYFNKFRASLKQAVKDRIISFNSSEDIRLPKVIEKEREYLTVEELRNLTKVGCRYEVLKRAFLFSCLTGLRWGDVHRLTWKEVHTSKDGTKIHYHQEKTKSLEYLFINNQALNYLGDRKDNNKRVFEGLKYSSYFNVALSRWVLKAGITKHITFHCGRHTYATLLLNTNKVDLLTVSKLLGHKDIKTTQVYAKIMDKTKRDAVNQIPEIVI
jgi:integrase/recombinase XerD